MSAPRGAGARRGADNSRGQRRLALTAATGTALFVLIAVLVRVDWRPLTHLDLRVADGLHRIVVAHPGQLPVWRGVSAVLSPGVLRVAAVVAAGVLFLWRRTLRSPLVLAVAALGTAVLDPVAKAIVDRDRPHFANPVAHAAGQSYPSGHALTSFVVAAVAMAICTPRVRRLALAPVVVAVAAVGFSRLMLGVHYPTDVVGAWLLGAAWVALVVLLAGAPLATRRLSDRRARDCPGGRCSRERHRRRQPAPPP